MNAFFLIIPLFLIRYGLLRLVNREALPRAALYAPMVGKEKVAFVLCQITTILMILYLFLLKVQTDSNWFYLGIAVYLLGAILYSISIIHFAHPKTTGLNVNGLYRISRHPMYVSFFIYFLGCVFLTKSWVLFALLIVYQLSAHWIILSEERWCLEKFGDEYRKYRTRVRRYL